MIRTPILDVVIGLFFIYFFLSIVCSAINEWVATFLTKRASQLEDSIRKMLSDPTRDLAQSVFDHGLIVGLKPRDTVTPSYIPSQTFATALLDVLSPASPDKIVKSFTDVRSAISGLTPGPTRSALLALADRSSADLSSLRLNIETWFDHSMDRVSGEYKRNARWWLVGIGFVVALVINADTFMIAERLYVNPALAETIVASAQNATAGGGSASQPAASPGANSGALTPTNPTPAKLPSDFGSQLQEFPLGWSVTSSAKDLLAETGSNPHQIVVNIFLKLLGLFFTAVFLSLGAPFWFDLLSMAVNLRSAGPKPDKAVPDSSS